MENHISLFLIVAKEDLETVWQRCRQLHTWLKCESTECDVAGCDHKQVEGQFQNA